MSTPSPWWRRLLRESQPIARLEGNPNRHWFVVGTVCIGAFIGQLDASIVTVALPRLSSAFHSSVGATEWVALAYLLVLVAAVTTVGHVSDAKGRKLLYVWGFGVFTAGSALCGLAPSLGWLIGARLLQGLGAAMLQANSAALIRHAVPDGQLGRAIGLQGTAQATGLALGPAVGGWLIALAGWRFIFFVNLPAGCLGIVLAWLLLPTSEDLAQRTRFDWPGAAILAVVVFLVMDVLSTGRSLGWGSPRLLAMVAASLILAAGLLWWERRHSEPVLDPRLFNADFTTGIVSGLLSYVVLFGVLFAVPYFLSLRHVDAATSGLWLSALPATLAIFAWLGGRLMDRVGARVPTATGMLVAAAGIGWLALAHGQGAGLILSLVVIGAGMGTFIPANNAAIVGAVSRERSGAAGGVLNMTRGLGTAVGVAVSSLAFSAGVDTESTGISHLQADRGLAAVAITLSAIALVATGVSVLRGSGDGSRRQAGATNAVDIVDAVGTGKVFVAKFTPADQTDREWFYVGVAGSNRGPWVDEHGRRRSPGWAFQSLRSGERITITSRGFEFAVQIPTVSEPLSADRPIRTGHELIMASPGRSSRLASGIQRLVSAPVTTRVTAHLPRELPSFLLDDLRRVPLQMREDVDRTGHVTLYVIRSPRLRGRINVRSLLLAELHDMTEAGGEIAARFGIREPPGQRRGVRPRPGGSRGCGLRGQARDDQASLPGLRGRRRHAWRGCRRCTAPVAGRPIPVPVADETDSQRRRV